ncbi:DUF192 domain-containing protein [Methylocapsa acidiphila]|uniref:DUF192 domain-containing protein n=1 Tax=Methylocapsa acidiphila TaxID=133552 RepID=UPI0004001CD7|nr:DUF192 domain-containing protein [Methylocapsa acidiphila]
MTEIAFGRRRKAATAARLAFLAFAVFGASLGTFLSAGALWAQASDGPDRGLETASFATASGPHEFKVEVMRTEQERQRGLMFRRFLPQDRGMLFIFETERPVAMWMKNTYLPLDMIFIGRSGGVVSVAENAEPLSEKIIPSGGPVFAVLEVNAGVAARIGLKPGDLLRSPEFGK